MHVRVIKLSAKLKLPLVTPSCCTFFNNKVLFSLSDKHNYIDLVYLVFYSILLHVSAILISHHQEGQWFTERVKCSRNPSVHTVDVTFYKLTIMTIRKN